MKYLRKSRNFKEVLPESKVLFGKGTERRGGSGGPWGSSCWRTHPHGDPDAGKGMEGVGKGQLSFSCSHQYSHQLKALSHVTKGCLHSRGDTHIPPFGQPCHLDTPSSLTLFTCPPKFLPTNEKRNGLIKSPFHAPLHTYIPVRTPALSRPDHRV